MHRFTKFLMLAVAVVAMGAATATAATLITGKQVKNKSLTGKDIKPSSLAAKHLSAKARASLAGQTGPQGQAGPQGQKGEKGDKGDRGPSTAFASRVTGFKGVVDDATSQIGSVKVPDGSYVVMGKAMVHNIGNATTAPACDLGVFRGLQFEALDTVKDADYTANGTAGDTRAISLMAVVTADNGTNELAMRCVPAGQPLEAYERVVIATQVAELK